MKYTPKGYKTRVAGHSEPVLYFKPLNSCGRISDGVSLEHGNEGVWIIDYKDLLEMARIATAKRAPNKRIQPTAPDGLKSKRVSKRRGG